MAEPTNYRYGVIDTLDEAREAAAEAEAEGLLGLYPAACVVMARELKRWEEAHAEWLASQQAAGLTAPLTIGQQLEWLGAHWTSEPVLVEIASAPTESGTYMVKLEGCSQWHSGVRLEDLRPVDAVTMPRAVAAAAESFLSGFEEDTGSDDNKGVPETLAGLRAALGVGGTDAR